MLPDIEQMAEVVVETIKEALAEPLDRIAELERQMDAVAVADDANLEAMAAECLRGEWK